MKKLMYLCIAAIVAVSCMNNENGGKDKSEYNSKRMQDFYDQVINAHNMAMIDSFCAPDIIDHQAPPNTPPGIEGVRNTFKGFFTAFPDMHFKTNFIKSVGDTIFSQITITGTNTGSFMGMPPTNKQMNYDGVDIVVVKDGKATEHWGYQEDMKMMAQLGMGQGPAPDAPKEGDANKK